MKVGVSLPMTGPLATGPGALDTILAFARKAEALGVDSLWLPDHIVIPTEIQSRYPYNKSGKFPLPAEMAFLEPLTVMGYLAGITKRVRIGTAVLVLPHRNPILLAKMFATLDVLSRGRMIAGAGIGWMEEEISLLGAPFQRRGTLSDEYLRIMRELWTNPGQGRRTLVGRDVLELGLYPLESVTRRFAEVCRTRRPRDFGDRSEGSRF